MTIERINSVLVILSVAVLTLSGCNKKSKDNNDAIALLLLSSFGGQSTQQKQASQVSTTITAVAGSISSSTSSNSVTGNFELNNPKKLFAMMNKQIIKKIIKNSNPFFMHTALSRDGGAGTCNASGCNATLSGTANCSSSGTYTLNSVAVTMSFPASNSYAATMSGPITLNNCGTFGTNYFDYPRYISGNSSGSLVMNTSVGFTISNLVSSGDFAAGTGAQTGTFKYTENGTYNSTDGLTINEVATGPISNLKSVTNLTINSNVKNARIASTTSGSKTTFTISGDYATVLTGSVDVSGSIGGSSANQNKTYDNTAFNYSLSCTGTSESSNFTFDCSVN